MTKEMIAELVAYIEKATSKEIQEIEFADLNPNIIKRILFVPDYLYADID